MKQQRIIFTDLDGTLLDKETYSHTAALPALQRIEALQIPLVLNSSKTVPEILSLRKQLGNQHPFVVENGAAVIIPSHYFEDTANLEPLQPFDQDDTYCIERFAEPHATIVEILLEARRHDFQFTGFFDMSVEKLAEITGLPESGARNAKQRIGSEPILFNGDISAFEAFLAEHQLRAVQGGRFLHVMGQFDKATGVNFLLQAYKKHYAPASIQSIALGDSHNDEEMLNCVDTPIVIKSPHSAQVHIEHPDRVRYSQATGASGWNEQLLALLNEPQ